MSFAFKMLGESARCLVVYLLFALNTAFANPLFPNEDSTVAFISEDEYGIVGSIHYRSPEYRYARVRLMHPDGPLIDLSSKVPFEIWIETDLGDLAVSALHNAIKRTIRGSVAQGGTAINEAQALGQAVGIDEVRAAAADFDRAIRSQLNQIARNAGGGTVISTGPFTSAFEGQHNAQFTVKYDPATTLFRHDYHVSRGFARTPRGISAENLENLATFIDEVVNRDEFSIQTRNNLIASAIDVENSPYGNRLRRTGQQYCRN